MPPISPDPLNCMMPVLSQSDLLTTLIIKAKTTPNFPSSGSQYLRGASAALALS